MNKHILVGFFILIFPFTCGFLNIAHRGVMNKESLQSIVGLPMIAQYVQK